MGAVFRTLLYEFASIYLPRRGRTRIFIGGNSSEQDGGTAKWQGECIELLPGHHNGFDNYT
jgi:hypothetical protein